MSEMKTRCCTKANSAAVEAMADGKSDDGSGNCSQTVVSTCPSCGHAVDLYGQPQGQIQELPWLPYGVKFDPTDREILQLLEAKVMEDGIRLHPLIDQLFIPTLEGDSGICYTHPEMLPGLRRDGQARHFFHRPSKAYTTGTRMRRKVHAGVSTEGETRWHKTGKTRPVIADGKTLGYKKILVLYTNFGRQRKPEKANWVMHQYHLGDQEDEKEGEFVISKVFYQTQPRQCANARSSDDKETRAGSEGISYDEDNVETITSPGPQQLIPNPVVQQQDELLFSQFIAEDPRRSVFVNKKM